MGTDIGADLAAYGALFVSAFTSATFLPGSSEAALLTLLAMGRGESATLVVVATAGNGLGTLVNWVLGKCFSAFRHPKPALLGSDTMRRAPQVPLGDKI